MRVFNVVELDDFVETQNSEFQGKPYTIYYGPVFDTGGVEPSMMASVSVQTSDEMGVMIILHNPDDSYRLWGSQQTRDLLAQNAYLGYDEVSNLIDEKIQNSGSGSHKDGTLLSDAWNTLGPISGSRVAHCFQGEAHWSVDSTGTVDREGFQHFLVGPAIIKPEYTEPDAAVVSEPFNVRVEFQYARAIYTIDDPLMIIAPMGLEDSRIVLYGNPASGKLMAACITVASFTETKVEGELEFGGIIAGKVLDFSFFPQGVQAMSPGKCVLNNQLFTPYYPSIDNFHFRLGHNAAIRWLNVSRVRNTAAVN